jgi:DNA (cytosine-5)-methyltransferase 1
MQKKINLFEAFSGIWSQHRALENIWFIVNSVWISDWYIDAIIAYGIEYLWIKWKKIDRIETINFLKWFSLSRDSKKPLKTFGWINDEKLSILEQVIKKFWNLDIRHIEWKDLLDKEIDLFTYSFPCQDISQQGKKAGFTKWKKSRSGLLWEIERILQEIKNLDKDKLPKVLMMENVKAILNKEFKSDLDWWIEELKNLWYESTKPFIVNSSDVWSPQNRSRVFMISKLKEEVKEFPEQKIDISTPWGWKKAKLVDILQKDDNREILNKSKYSWFKILPNKKENSVKKAILEWYTTFNSENYVYYKDWLAPTITASGAQSRIKFFWENNEVYFLNALEHLLLQWFNKNFYNKLKKLDFTETKIKFLAWNSINVKVLEKIFAFYLK